MALTERGSKCDLACEGLGTGGLQVGQRAAANLYGVRYA